MALKEKSKFKNNSKWKPVEISGSVFNGTEDFHGFAGLEVLENYDSSFLLSNSKQNQDFSTSELDGDIYDARKRKFEDSEDENDEIIVEPIKKKSKKKPTEEISYPGKFVLLQKPELKTQSDDLSIDFESQGSAVRATWNQIGVLSDAIIRALFEMKFHSPTEIQRVSLPVSVHGKHDILGAAPTGSGKTLAFGIPIIQNIEKILCETDEERTDLFSVILTPTRELAQQIEKHLKAIAKYTKVKIACIIGGLATVKQERILKSSPHIVIGTPGRVWELIQDGNEHLQKINDIKYFVVDETDRMAEKGHFAEMEEILKSLKSSGKKRQTFVFSATLTMVQEFPLHSQKKGKKHKVAPSKKEIGDKRLNEFIEMFGMENPKIYEVTSQSGVAEKLIEARILCSLEEKDFYLYYIIINYPGRTIVFCNSIECVKRSSSVLAHLNLTPIVLHGKMEQKQRLKSLEGFQKNEDGILVTTQVAARGLDIPNVQHVIHYQVPTSAEDYVHRSGRTARADKEGLSVLIMEPSEVKYFVRLQKALGRNEDFPIFPTDARIMKTVRERVRLAREIEDIDLQIRRKNDNRNWKKQAAEDIGILVDSEDSDSDNGHKNNKANKQIDLVLKQKKMVLGKILSAKIVPNNNQSMKFPISCDLTKIETNSIQVVKNLTSSNKKGGMKLYRQKK